MGKQDVDEVELLKIYEYLRDEHGIPTSISDAYFNNFHYYDIDALATSIVDDTYGQWEDWTDFAMDTLDSFIDFRNEWWGSYINFESMGEDMSNGDWFSVPYQGGIWVFRSR
jgi:hypothetical protein